MNTIQKAFDRLNLAGQTIPRQFLQISQGFLTAEDKFKKLRGGLLFIIGYLLSPLCWWNDLVFNLPVAYGFGYLCSLFAPQLLVPFSILGYWLSNVVGILLMQFGAVDVFYEQAKKRDRKKELWTGLLSSTVFTLVILGLIQFKILETPALFAGG